MGDASDIACLRNVHAAERIAPHRRIDLHERVDLWRVFLTAIVSSIHRFDCLHTRLSACLRQIFAGVKIAPKDHATARMGKQEERLTVEILRLIE